MQLQVTSDHSQFSIVIVGGIFRLPHRRSSILEFPTETIMLLTLYCSLRICKFIAPIPTYNTLLCMPLAWICK